MRYLLAITLLAVACGPPVQADAADDSAVVSLRYRSYRNWKIHLPEFQWIPLNDGFRVPHAGGDLFPVTQVGNDLNVDTDGDGKLDRMIKPQVNTVTGVASARVILTSRTKAGDEFRYAARIQKDGGDWEWAPGGAMVGSISTENGPLPIRLIDRNGNGRFDEFGTDGLIVGVSDEATLLSQAVVIDGELQELTVLDNGAGVRLSEFEGPTATLDMSTSFDSEGVLLSAIVRSFDGRYSFDFGRFDGPVEIPSGTYQVVAGAIGLGQQRVEIHAGRMKPIKLEAGDEQRVAWGGPAKPEFRFEREGARVRFTPLKIWYYGRAGEEYRNWSPVGKSPEFTIRDRDTGAVLEVAILPGSC